MQSVYLNSLFLYNGLYNAEENRENPLQTEIPEFINAAAQAFKANGTPLYLVGGWPRNRLLGLPPGDLDVASELTPEKAAQLFNQVPGIRVIERDTRLGTLGVLSEGIQAEYTAFRTESYGEGGAHRPDDVHFGATMKQDALRRDFTVNALYYDIAQGTDTDPLGGLPDVSAKILRTCRQPRETFADDGLRLMRLVRFASELGFEAEQETFGTARANARLILDIAPERIQAELNKLLLSDVRYPESKWETSPVLRGLHMLDTLGLLTLIAPEFESCRGVAQRKDFHDHDVLEHLFRTCACAPAKLEMRLAALLHDIGKPAALKAGGVMHSHDKLGEPMAREILTRLRYPNAVVDEVAALVRTHMYDLDGRTGEKRLRLFFTEMGKERAWKLVEIRRADVCGSKDEPSPFDPAAKWANLLTRMDEERVPWTQRELNVSGNELAALTGGPSKAVGRLKRVLHEHAVLHPRDNERDKLLKMAGNLLNDKHRFPGKENK
jgi:tRNA nucleotidyltransferase (CCA-adding enzyme)